MAHLLHPVSLLPVWCWWNSSSLWREYYTMCKHHRHLPRITSQDLKQNTRKKAISPNWAPKGPKSILNVSSKTLKIIILDRSQSLACFNVLLSTNKGSFQNHCLGWLWKVPRIKVLGWPQNYWARVTKAVDEAGKEKKKKSDDVWCRN